MGKFHAGQSQICGENSGTGHGNARHNTNGSIVNLLDTIQTILQADGQSRQQIIRRQHIGARSQHTPGTRKFLAGSQHLSQLRATIGKRHDFCRSTDAEGGMLAHRLIKTK